MSPKGHYGSLRYIGSTEIKAAQKQAAKRRLKRNTIIAVGLVVLYLAVTYVIAHVGGTP